MATSRFRKPIDAVCRFSYIAALAIGVLLLVLSRYQQTNNDHVSVLRLLPGNQVEIRTPDAPLEVGQPLSMYRFNDGYKEPIGRARVESVDGDVTRASFDPESFTFPVAMQGTVTEATSRTVRINIGTQVGLKRGTKMFLFDGATRLAETSVMNLTDDSALLGRPTSLSRDPVGLTASQYTIADRIAVHKNPGFDSVVIGSVAALGSLLLLWVVVPARVEPVFRAWTARVRGVLTAPATRTAFVWVVGVPAAYIFGKFTLYVFPFILWKIDQVLPAQYRMGIQWTGVWEAVGVPVVIALSFAYYVTLFRTKRAPLLLLWQELGYQRPEYAWREKLPKSIPPVPRRIVDWALHLVIAYAFASMLLGFLVGNLSVMANTGYGELDLPFVGALNVLSSVGTMATTVPTLETPSEVFTFLRLFLFSTAIAACILLYGHTVVTAVYANTLHNVDFTVAGWVTNSVCYSTLLGPVVWTMAPGVWGHEPGIADGALFWAVPSAELFLNLVYTLSLFNLGKMFGVMVDKGVRTTGFYSVVRHPSYTVESIMFMLTSALAATTWLHNLGMLVYVFIYWLRSEREDQFMSAANPDFAEYKKQVPYKFIPGIY